MISQLIMYEMGGERGKGIGVDVALLKVYVYLVQNYVYERN